MARFLAHALTSPFTFGFTSILFYQASIFHSLNKVIHLSSIGLFIKDVYTSLYSKYLSAFYICVCSKYIISRVPFLFSFFVPYKIVHLSLTSVRSHIFSKKINK